MRTALLWPQLCHMTTSDTGLQTTLHLADTRGQANHGWLNSHHSFSFAGYHKADRMHFGVLRVLNDDQVAPGRGFGTHPHDNMEIISIPLQGDLVHQDSMGNKTVIHQGDIQAMSAGTGIQHSEFNGNNDKEVHFLQIWIFPRERGVQPRHDQQAIPDTRNKLVQILSPNADDDGVWIHQDAWFHVGNMDAGFQTEYALKKSGNGLYAFVLEGSVKIGDQVLSRRDGIGIWDTDSIQMEATQDARILLMDVPMALPTTA